MLAALMVGILIDRQNSPKRSVFFAAFLILLFNPESIFHPGFQMSFAAVVALIGTYEIYSKKVLAKRGDRFSVFGKIKFYFFRNNCLLIYSGYCYLHICNVSFPQLF